MCYLRDVRSALELRSLVRDSFPCCLPSEAPTTLTALRLELILMTPHALSHAAEIASAALDPFPVYFTPFRPHPCPTD